jgi:homoserine dehydrogenase
MDSHKQLTIGLFGFGVVGEGLYKILQQTPSLKASIKTIVIKEIDETKDEYLKNTELQKGTDIDEIENFNSFNCFKCLR